MALTEETIRDQIPFYLTQPQKQSLAAGLREFEQSSTISPFSISQYAYETLQGDGWSKFQIFNFDTGVRRNVRGMVISNSCDIDPDNRRDLPSKITFVPLIQLGRLERMWLDSGLTAERLSQKLADIRAQRITDFFYIPQCGQLEEESVAILNDVHTMPLNAFLNSSQRQKLFTLSQVAFYLLLFKLSVHFCRMHENVSR
jgi:hypothetical protein